MFARRFAARSASPKTCLTPSGDRGGVPEGFVAPSCCHDAAVSAPSGPFYHWDRFRGKSSFAASIDCQLWRVYYFLVFIFLSSQNLFKKSKFVPALSSFFRDFPRALSSESVLRLRPVSVRQVWMPSSRAIPGYVLGEIF